MTDKRLNRILSEFVSGLLKKANCNHAGNCYMMCQIVKPYLSGLFDVDTLICNTKVKQGRKRVNHYYLLRVKDGTIIDPTASQFIQPSGERMPKIYIGECPAWYGAKMNGT